MMIWFVLQGIFFITPHTKVIFGGGFEHSAVLSSFFDTRVYNQGCLQVRNWQGSRRQGRESP